MSLILHIETSTATCSVALSENGNLLGTIDRTDKNIHASSLTLFIEELLHQSGRNIKDLDAVAVSMGPGSYTGLRIGVSTAKGLCYALDIPLIAVNTLEAMANGFKNRCFSVNKQTLFCPMIDARRMEVYCAVFDDELNMVKGVDAVIIDENSFKDILDTHIVYFFGDGSAKCEDVLGTHLNARVLDIYVNNAADMVNIAQEKFDNGNFVDVAYFEPFYLKDYVAGVKKTGVS
ncbi:peptidase M22 glycoprotease [Pseudopedobacter saltans DSM 12145]|uniref:Peptidase M22 glycoprotease n=1 Tax=Pseudopedobacter saltans (strain ATCC 51119 / DSM 12145 / JCM 21818 / CCUG 39354 / LMG 10337 / NBRC 100064 / NCIMB 13643) TaxID=762903 RepID=F0S852_PSESL|nr:tRNA (adenosine(37)-N6)-threonylcarbamoyltransferase complex dimerization subunit type 1 TsaB [Pseudopedobacter saltans]ADY52314.1 peptidase M22 glycoprotease [Pseudopedobacter saltans DSM 12145]